MQPSFTEYQQRAKRENLIPVWEEYLVDFETPVSIYAKFCLGKEKKIDFPFSSEVLPEHTFLLESVEGGENLARYSFLGLAPTLTFTARGKEIFLRTKAGVTSFNCEPFAALKQLLQNWQTGSYPTLPRFFGGLVGYFGYDLVRNWEKIPESAGDGEGFPDCYLVFNRIFLIYDHVKNSLQAVVLSFPGENPAASYREAIETLKVLEEELTPSFFGEKYFSFWKEEANDSFYQPGIYRSNMTRTGFLQKVKQAKEYIAAGDILQVVLSQRLETTLKASPFNIYRILRNLNPSPYMYYLDFEPFRLIGASPEMLVRVENGRVQTRPIAGTRPRGKTLAEDKALAAELLADPKERAEHVMLVDLGRNDVGRVSRFGTVKVPQFMEVEFYSHVMHLVSAVEGELSSGYTALDALQACFPAGTVTGAPKVRAMEIIAELEPTRRGPYAGAVGYIGLSGNLDTCIAIRTIFAVGNKAFTQAGAGIVADSIPAREYEETLEKAAAPLRALACAPAAKKEGEVELGHRY